MGSEDERRTEGERGRVRGGGCALAAAVVLVLVALVGLALYVYDLRWERKLDAKLAEFRAAGQPVTWEEVLAAREPIPDEENSALILLGAFTHLEGAEGAIAERVYESGYEGAQGARHSEQMRGMLSSHLEANAEALRLIHEAAQFPRGAYPIDPRLSPWEVDTDYLSQMRAAGRLCVVEAAFHAEEGDADNAVRSLVAGRRLGASFGDWPLLLELFVRWAMQAIWVEELEHSLALCEMSAEQLAMLREEMAQEQEQDSLERVFLAERAEGHYVFEGGLFAPDLDPVWRIYRVIPGWRERDALYYYGVMEQAVSLCSLPPYQRVEEARALSRDVEAELDAHGLKYWLSCMTTPSIGRILEAEVNARATLRVAQAALAVEEWRLENGRWPESLEQLVPGFLDTVPEDPFSDRPLYYVKADTGVALYSVGPDGQDDGGVSQDQAFESAGYAVDEGWDIPFRLLNPELRGARTLTFREEIMASGLDVAELEEAGFTREKLEALGLTPDDLRELGWQR